MPSPRRGTHGTWWIGGFWSGIADRGSGIGRQATANGHDSVSTWPPRTGISWCSRGCLSRTSTTAGCARRCISTCSRRFAPRRKRRDGLPASSAPGRFVHSLVGQAIGFLVVLAADVLELHVTNLLRQAARLLPERLKPWMLHPVFAAHLFHQQVGVRFDVELLDAVVRRPVERGEQAAIFGDVVGGDAHRLLQFDHRAVAELNPDAVAGRARVAAGATVDIRDRGAAASRAEERRLLAPAKVHEEWVTAGSA